MSPRANELCSTGEAASLLGISLRTVQLWVERGALRAWKTEGGHRRILRSSVEALLEERRRSVGRADGPRILVVEDEPDLVKLYRLVIEGWGLRPRLAIAHDGFEGLIRVGEFRPHLVISDLNLPGMDGFRMIRALRARADSEMAIVVVTALGASEIADRGGLPPGVRVLGKPVPFSELEALVRSVWAIHQPVPGGAHAALP